jgi:phenylalanyl-tRNA synthetase alpha chain
MDQEKLISVVLKEIATKGCLENSAALSKQTGANGIAVYAALASLEAEKYIELSKIEAKSIELSEEGAGYAARGTAEKQYVDCLVFGEETLKTEVEQRVGAQIAKVGFGKAMKNKWV